jgi:chromosome segregation ATPase
MNKVVATALAVTVVGVLATAAPGSTSQHGPTGGGHSPDPHGRAPAVEPRGDQERQQAQEHQRAREQRQEQVRASEEQRRQLQAGSECASRAITQAREMERVLKGAGPSLGEARRQQDRVREEVRTLAQEQQRLEAGMSPEQRSGLQDRLRRLEQERLRVEEHVRALDGGLAAPAPDPRQIAAHSRDLERSLKRWQKEHRALSADMGAAE